MNIISTMLYITFIILNIFKNKNICSSNSQTIYNDLYFYTLDYVSKLNIVEKSVLKKLSLIIIYYLNYVILVWGKYMFEWVNDLSVIVLLRKKKLMYKRELGIL